MTCLQRDMGATTHREGKGARLAGAPTVLTLVPVEMQPNAQVDLGGSSCHMVTRLRARVTQGL